MITVMCTGCRGTKDVPNDLAGRRVVCSRCGAKTTVPAAGTAEVDVAEYLRAIDAATERETESVEINIWAPGGSSLGFR